MEYIRTNIQAQDILVARLSKVTNRFKKPRVLSIGNEVYRIEKQADGTLKIGKK